MPLHCFYKVILRTCNVSHLQVREQFAGIQPLVTATAFSSAPRIPLPASTAKLPLENAMYDLLVFFPERKRENGHNIKVEKDNLVGLKMNFFTFKIVLLD